MAWLKKHFDHILSPNAACLTRQDCIANLKQELVREQNTNLHCRTFQPAKNTVDLLLEQNLTFVADFGKNALNFFLY